MTANLGYLSGLGGGGSNSANRDIDENYIIEWNRDDLKRSNLVVLTRRPRLTSEVRRFSLNIFLGLFF